MLSLSRWRRLAGALAAACLLLASDALAASLYWTQSLDDELYRSNLDGTNQELLFDTENNPFAMDVSLAQQKIYYTTSCPGSCRRARG